jgi:hypothetical protein
MKSLLWLILLLATPAVAECPGRLVYPAPEERQSELSERPTPLRIIADRRSAIHGRFVALRGTEVFLDRGDGRPVSVSCPRDQTRFCATLRPCQLVYAVVTIETLSTGVSPDGLATSCWLRGLRLQVLE